MEGNTFPELDYAIRITFGIVHGVILTLCSFGIALYVPELSRVLFALLGCIVAPFLSLLLTIFCNAAVEYSSKSTLTMDHILQTAWIPPLGIFCMNVLLLPLELMPSAETDGPLTMIVATSILGNLLISILLQVYAARNIQLTSDGFSGPI